MAKKIKAQMKLTIFTLGEKIKDLMFHQETMTEADFNHEKALEEIRMQSYSIRRTII